MTHCGQSHVRKLWPTWVEADSEDAYIQRFVESDMGSTCHWSMNDESLSFFVVDWIMVARRSHAFFRPQRGLTVLVLAIAISFFAKANAADDTFTNPILRGGYPDPSICRVGDNFYIVNSSFEYFPGLPLHHSTDLVNWELVGYGLHREEQVTGAVNLVDVQSNGGIHAPTLRCHDGLFHIITTNVYLTQGNNPITEFVNFVITAENIEGPWSEPHVIEGAPGIDPDLFFDDDGRVCGMFTYKKYKCDCCGKIITVLNAVVEKG